ncbi:MAG: hypothetical protein AB7I57_00415 [Pirellulales bacterium]
MTQPSISIPGAVNVLLENLMCITMQDANDINSRFNGCQVSNAGYRTPNRTHRESLRFETRHYEASGRFSTDSAHGPNYRLQKPLRSDFIIRCNFRDERHKILGHDRSATNWPAVATIIRAILSDKSWQNLSPIFSGHGHRWPTLQPLTNQALHIFSDPIPSFPLDEPPQVLADRSKLVLRKCLYHKLLQFLIQLKARQQLLIM